MRTFVLFSLLLGFTGVLNAQSDVLRVPEGLDESTINEHRLALVLLNEMHDNAHHFVDTTMQPSKFHIEQSKRYYQLAQKRDIQWLAAQGYLYERIYMDKQEQAHLMLHLNPSVEFRYTKAEVSADEAMRQSLAEFGKNYRKAWSAQGIAIGLALVGGGVSVASYLGDRPRTGRNVLLVTLTGVIACEIAFLTFQLQAGRALEVMPGGARYTFYETTAYSEPYIYTT